MSRISKTYQTEDGHVFLNLHDAERHDDSLQLALKLKDECQLGNNSYSTTAMEVAEWLINNYDMTPKNQLPAQD